VVLRPGRGLRPADVGFGRCSGCDRAGSLFTKLAEKPGWKTKALGKGCKEQK
jgi:hypothetical protein